MREEGVLYCFEQSVVVESRVVEAAEQSQHFVERAAFVDELRGQQGWVGFGAGLVYAAQVVALP